MRKYSLLILFFSFALTQTSFSQPETIRQLKIGDPVPDILIEQLVNYSKKNIRISDFKGKILILDFWSIHCKSCIKAFPKYADIQNKFTEKIKILPVSFGSPKDEVVSFYEKMKKANKEILLPSAVFEDVRDNVFYKLFPIIEAGFPVIIWINSKGILKGITQSEELTESNIAKILKSEDIQLSSRTYQKTFDFSKPYLVNQNGGSAESFLYRSIISGFSDSIVLYQFVRQQEVNFTRFFIPNQSISGLLQECMYEGNNEDVYRKKLLLNVGNPSRYIISDTSSIQQKKANSFCYELILPPYFTLSNAYQFMQEDLCRFFQISANFEVKTVPCLVITVCDENLLKSKGGSPYTKYSTDELTLNLRNKKIGDLVRFLNKENYPNIIDESNFINPVDISFSLPEIYNFEHLRKLLMPFGIELSLANRPIKHLVIKELASK